MNKYKQVFISLTVLTYLLSAGITTAYALPTEYRDGNDNRRGEILDAFENEDYDAWKRVVGQNHGFDQFISKEEFGEFVDARKLAREGKYDEALEKVEMIGKQLNKNTVSALSSPNASDLEYKLFTLSDNIDIMKKDLENNL